MRATFSRSPGERAFDRCFYPFGAILGLWIVGIFVDAFFRDSGARKLHSEAELSTAVPDPAWHAWLPYAISVILCGYWFWALLSVLRAWTDPRARILRLSALTLLIFYAGVAYLLLTSLSSE